MTYADEHNHIILDTRRPNRNEFIISPRAGIQEDAVRDMFRFIEDNSNLKIERIPSYELPESYINIYEKSNF